MLKSILNIFKKNEPKVIPPSFERMELQQLKQGDIIKVIGGSCPYYSLERKILQTTKPRISRDELENLKLTVIKKESLKNPSKKPRGYNYKIEVMVGAFFFTIRAYENSPILKQITI